jgi:hypothetical protein
MATPNEPQGEFLDDSLEDRLAASLMAAQMSMIALYEPFNHIVSNHRMFDTATLLEMEVMIQGLTAHIMELSRSLDEQKVDFLW